MEDMKPVYIKWKDACGGDGWIEEKELKQITPVIHETIGYLAHETDEFITICMSHNPKRDNLGAYMCIPKLYILKRKNIKL